MLNNTIKELIIVSLIMAVLISVVLFCILFLLNKGKRKNIISEICVSIIAGILVQMITTTEDFPRPKQPENTEMPIEVVGVQKFVEPTFIKRSSEKFNYIIDCPSDFVFEGALEHDTEDDFNLASPDHKATLNFTARITNGTLPDKFTIDYFRRIYAGTELYSDDQMESDGWYAISTKAADGYYHYRKCIFTDGTVRMYTFSFPIEQEEIYLLNYDYVSHIEKSFRKIN